MMSLENPTMDFVAMSKSMGVPASRASTCEELIAALQANLKEPGPNLIEVVL
jgi:acetolactate synthase-1/2/3 large subunit